MTLRETAAIAALKGLVGCEHDPVYAALISVDAINSTDFGTPEYYAKLTAKASIVYAEALLDELGVNDTTVNIPFAELPDEILFESPDPVWDYYELWQNLHGVKNEIYRILSYIAPHENSTEVVDKEIRQKLTALVYSVEDLVDNLEAKTNAR